MAALRPRLPTGTRAYVIGDIHGRADLLSPLLERIDADLQERPVPYPVEIFLGDYIDRGPNSREVIDRLIARSRVRETIFLKGNHETYLAGFLDQPAMLGEWRQIGGLETLMSYGMQPSLRMEPDEQIRLAAAFKRVLPESHRLFLNSLSTSLSGGDYFFVHAGIRPGVPLAEQRDEDLLWIREDFLLCEESFGRVIVHGHSPVPEPEMRPNRINIDTGAYATGRLTCLVLEEEDRHFL